VPDFRLRSDRYLSLEAEREKAGRLFEASSRLTFQELLAYYYSITDDVTPHRAKAYASYVISGPERAAHDIDAFGPIAAEAALLDAGCGAGAALVAAQGRFKSVTGADIALRWLVMCRKRLDELGMEANLVCADIEALPFETGQFTCVMAADVIEHVYDQGASIKALAAQLAPGGLLWLSAINRWWPGPHPSTGRWAAGYRRSAADASGYDALRFVTNISANDARLLCEEAGMEVLSTSARRVAGGSEQGRSTARAMAIGAYTALRGMPVMRPIMVKAGPAFELLARAPAGRTRGEL
jgi:SAM-dependent methyltransferase